MGDTERGGTLPLYSLSLRNTLKDSYVQPFLPVFLVSSYLHFDCEYHYKNHLTANQTTNVTVLLQSFYGVTKVAAGCRLKLIISV